MGLRLVCVSIVDFGKREAGNDRSEELTTKSPQNRTSE
jgi:hypothetical protein